MIPDYTDDIDLDIDPDLQEKMIMELDLWLDIYETDIILDEIMSIFD